MSGSVSMKAVMAVAMAAIMALAGLAMVYSEQSDATGEDLEGYGSVNDIDIMPGYTWSYTSRFAADLTAGMVLDFKVNELSTNATIDGHKLTVSIPNGYPVGSYNIVLVAEHADSGQTEENGRAAYQWIRINVNTDLELSYTDAVNHIIVGASQEINLVSEGGIGTYTWQSKQMPAGLELQGSKVVGTPTTVGLNTVVVTAVSDTEGVQSQDLTIEFTVFNKIVGGSPETITSTGAEDDATSTAIQQTGDDLGVTWALTNGTLPSGFQVNASTGQVHGAYTGSQHGSAVLTLTGTAANGPAQTATKQVTVQYEPAITLSGNASLLTYTGNAKDVTLQVTPSAGTSDIEWSVTELAGVSVADGLVTVKGTAAVTPSTEVTVTAQTAYGQTVTHQFSLMVEDTLEITGPTSLGTSAGILASTSEYTISGGSGNSVEITADGGYGDSVSWDDESNKLSVNHPSRHDAGTVTLMVTSAAGQTDTIDVTVTVYSSIGFDSAPGADGFYTYMLD